MGYRVGYCNCDAKDITALVRLWDEGPSPVASVLLIGQNPRESRKAMKVSHLAQARIGLSY